jgi:glyoxylase-like metal-dependent hydrolase (beta-lactamase superfamily II)
MALLDSLESFAAQDPPMPALPPFIEPIGDGIHAIDTGFHRPRFDASYLIVEAGRAAFVDTGTNASVPRLLAGLDALGVARDAVDFVIATHVHLDHAGGAGLLMRHLPSARLVVHPHGARHLIDPGRLMASAGGVYGEAEVARSYGDVLAVDAGRVLRTADGMMLDLAGRALKILDTPGHARHHHCVWDARSRGIFTGDTFGLSYREFDTERGPWMLPTTTPIQFQPEALRRSVQRLVAYEPQSLYLTHYGRVDEAHRLAALLLEQMDAMVALATALPDDPGRHAALVHGYASLYRHRLRAHGCPLTDARIDELLALDCELNAQGMAFWLNRERHRRPA